MKRFRSPIVLGIILTVAFFVIHLVIIDDYGLTWDFHHHFFAGLYHLGIPVSPELTDHIPFTIPDPRTTSELPFGPIMLITPVVSYELFHAIWHVLPLDSAYSVGIILVAMLGILSLYIFVLEAEGFPTAFFAFLFLALFPRYFGDLHNNMKDVPQSAAFALAVWMYWRLLNYRRPKDVLLASVGFAIAFNMKINTLFVPVIACIWTAIVLITPLKKHLRRPIQSLRRRDFLTIGTYFLLAPIAAFIVWMPFWHDPVERLNYLFRFFQDNTKNLEVLFFGKIYRSTINVPWYYSFGYIGITTPLPVLLAFFFGCMALIKKFFQKNPTGILFLLWLVIPLTRYFDPSIGVIDGIRHFEEVIYPLCAIAAIGAVSAFGVWKKSVKSKFLRLLPALFLTLYLGITVVLYHPYQITYFNELVGGIQGALGKFDLDYWGTSQKQAILWLNAHARPGSVVHIVLASESASVYLRHDLLEKVNTKDYDQADYLVVLNRQSFFYRFYSLIAYTQNKKPVYEVKLMGVPLVMVFDNSLPPVPFPNPWWLNPVFAP